VAVLLLGLGLRSYHYLREPGVWHDEAVLIVNVLGKSFLDLLGPLFYAEAAPPLFLWVEKLVSLVLGDGTFALRLLPFLASCASLLLLAFVARHWLTPPAALCAVLLFACSDCLLWHCCEAKPYALDVLAGCTMLTVWCLGENWPLLRTIALYIVLAPLVIFLCYPGVFLFGGVLLALLPAVWRKRRRSVVLAYGTLGLVVGAAFLMLLLGPIRAQRCPEMDSCWLGHFPPWDRPWAVPWWVGCSTLEVFRYAVKPWGQLLAPFALAGGLRWWRQQQPARVLLLAVPLGLALAASLVGAYPYGGSRVEVFAAPGLVLLIAAGVPPIWVWLRGRSRWAPALVILFLAAPLVWSLHRLAVPWPRTECAQAAAYVLARRCPGEAIAGNHWEQLYYFRRQGSPLAICRELPDGSGQRYWFAFWPGTPGETWERDCSLGTADRVWFVTIGATLAERTCLFQVLPLHDWALIDRREFRDTSVFLLQRSARVR
jgi:hypothetical protein